MILHRETLIVCVCVCVSFDCLSTARINMHNHFVIKHLAPQSEDYVVDHVHFHWGDVDSMNGSEHLLEGQSYPLEVSRIRSKLYEYCFQTWI
jgi:carbonic anhydrase